MTTDVIFKERGCHWSQQMATTRWLQCDQTLPLCEGCDLRDYVYVVITSPLFTAMSLYILPLQCLTNLALYRNNSIHPLRVSAQL